MRAIPVLPVIPVIPVIPAVWQLGDVGVAEIDLSFSARAGDIVHVRGGSVMARLRVLTMAAGFVPGASGRCSILGHDLQALDDDDRRALRQQHIARVLAGDALPAAASVLHCVAQLLQRRGLPATVALARARHELHALCAGDLADQQPDQLPHGLRRLVLLAHAMVTRPRLLVLEQPEQGLAGVDGTEGVALSALRQALWSLAGDAGTCIVMTTAHPRLAASANRVLDLDMDLAPGHGAASHCALAAAAARGATAVGTQGVRA